MDVVIWHSGSDDLPAIPKPYRLNRRVMAQWRLRKVRVTQAENHIFLTLESI